MTLRLTYLGVVILVLALLLVPSLVSADNTNYPYSQQINRSTYYSSTGLTITADVATAPDGTLTAEMVNETATTDNHRMASEVAYTTTAGTNFTHSLYLKKVSGGPHIFQLTMTGARMGTGFVNVNLTDGTISASTANLVTITDAGNGWYRITNSENCISSGFTNAFLVFTNNNPAAARYPSYAGTATNAVYAWGWQQDDGNTADSYTATNEAIVASFTVNQTSGGAPLPVLLTDTSTQDTNNRTWAFNNVTGNNTWVKFGYGSTITKSFPAGNYSINLTAANDFGSGILPNISTQKTWVNVSASAGGSPPEAAFSASRTSAGYGAPITFTDASTNTPSSWYWEFGDGNTSTVQNPVHVYAFAGTFTVNLKATNGDGSDWENKTGYITIGTRPDSYVNPYTKMIPWLDQGDQGWCGGASTANTMMLMRYQKLGTPPSATQEPFTRDVGYTVGGITYWSDTHVNYTPSVASLYWYFDTLSGGNHWNYTALAETMKVGYNLQTDEITSKYNDTEVYYPKSKAFLDAHRYNKIGDYEIQVGDTAATWESLKQNISDHGVVLIEIDLYSTYEDNSTHVTLDNGQVATMFPNPTGSYVDGHYMAAVGYNGTRDEVYTLQSWGDDRYSKNWTKLAGITKTYWTYGSPRQNFIVPHNMTVDEILTDIFPPAAITNLANSTPNSSSVTISWTNPADPDYYRLNVYRGNTWYENVSNGSVSTTWTGLTNNTVYSFNSTTEDLTGNRNVTHWQNLSFRTTEFDAAESGWLWKWWYYMTHIWGLSYWEV